MILPLLAIPFVGALAAWLFRHLRPVCALVAAIAALAVTFMALWGMDTAPFVVLGRTIALDAAMRAHLSLVMLLLALTMAATTLARERDVAASLALTGLGVALFALAVQNLILSMLILQGALVILMMVVPHNAGTFAPTNMRTLVMLVIAGAALTVSAWLMENPGARGVGPLGLAVGTCIVLGVFPFFVWQLPIYRSGSSLACIVFGVAIPHLLLVRMLTLEGGGLLTLAGGAPAALLLHAGIATFVVGCVGALAQQTMSGALGYMALGELGFVLMALGSHTPATQALAMLHLILRGAAIVALSVGVGVLRHSFGSDSLSSLRGALRRAPLTSLGMLLAGLSLAGFPPLAGFVTRLALYRNVALQDLGWALVLAAIGLAPACVVVRFGLGAFQLAPLPESRPEPLWPALLVLLLGIGLLAVGLAPHILHYLPVEWSELLFGLVHAGA
jgi:multicomponent Na+:H+ antiporter subunit A